MDLCHFISVPAGKKFFDRWEHVQVLAIPAGLLPGFRWTPASGASNACTPMIIARLLRTTAIIPSRGLGLDMGYLKGRNTSRLPVRPTRREGYTTAVCLSVLLAGG